VELINPVVRRKLREGRDDPEAFWAAAARELPWFRPWDSVLEQDEGGDPAFRWFAGARTNMAHNCLDRHVAAGRGGHTALVYASERGERRLFTYASLLREVERTAAALRGLGIGKGDRITLSMPTCPEAIVLMLAAVRIGAIHSVVFAGFGSGALGGRILAAGSKAVFTADVTWRKGKAVPLAGIVATALEQAGDSVEHVVTLVREPSGDRALPGGDKALAWDEFLAAGDGHSGAHEELDAGHPAFILATSGTTATPKQVVHPHGGYQVHIFSTARWLFGLRSSDVWWSTSDIGWIVGHSYIVYAPLLAGATTIAYEGAYDHPGPDAIWKLVEEYAVTGIFTSPTAVRLLMRYGEAPLAGRDLSSLERVFSAGEVLNAPAWEWLQETALGGRVPVIDHMWQTETSGPVFGNPYGLGMLPIKPGSATIPLPGIGAKVVDGDGKELPPGEKGTMVFTRPFPGLVATLWNDPKRYHSDYWGRIPGVYVTGDSASVDSDGYVWFSGRADEIIKIAAHRIGTIEVETAFMRHPAVAEAGATGRPDELRGEVISAFVTLKADREPSDDLRRELIETVRSELGPVAVIGEVNFVGSLPKTRSGKIMRRVLKAVTVGRDPGDITTIEDEGSVEDARSAWETMRAEIGG
jgi:acetyl-CoA synthetase